MERRIGLWKSFLRPAGRWIIIESCISTKVREYWIVDKEKNRVMVYSFEKGTGEEYTFEDVVPAGIYKDFWIDFKEIV